MRDLVSKKKLMIGTAAVLFLFALNLISSQVRNFAMGISSPVQAVLWGTGHSISTFFGGGKLLLENEVLKQENLALLSQHIALEDLEKENEELRRILDLGVTQEFRMVMGEIIGKNLMEDVIVIRGGENNGIQKGMPVITSEKVVVGRVLESFFSYAHVQLISANEQRLDAQIMEANATGVVRGQGGQKLMLDLVPQEEDFQIGDVLVTSNLGEVFPENLLIGEVTEILTVGADPFQRAKVKPFFNMKSAEILFVITSFEL